MDLSLIIALRSHAGIATLSFGPSTSQRSEFVRVAFSWAIEVTAVVAGSVVLITIPMMNLLRATMMID